MKIGLTLAQLGSFANPDSVLTMARDAEARGYDSLWVIDRLLDPVHPRSRYPVSADGRIPTEQQTALDPLVTLAHAAAVTSRIGLGTNVLVAPWYRPVLLARSLASLDVLSRGRLAIGLGLGWSADEYAAVGVPQRNLAARQLELIDALEALWGDGPVSYGGHDFNVPITHIRPRPQQRPRPPILLAAYTPAGLRRAGQRADGWTPSGLDLPTTAAMWNVVTNAAEDAGRDPRQLSLVVHANVKDTGADAGPHRTTFHGSIRQIGADLRQAAAIGVHEVILYVQGSTTSVQEALDLADRVRAAALPLAA
ncbi:MAG: TIGR03619 family F420-dependent LLM class oxidoreductase [Acidimicrobiales bacterium]